ncbi:MAG TPA: OmpA family protein [Bacteroidales bacterium]|nr:OmpA family protein [Bacteroidales bacterium]
MKNIPVLLSAFMFAAFSYVLQAQDNGDWGNPYSVLKDQPEADLIVRVGDIDNLGFGWPEEFNPFAGKNTDPHDYPWEAESDDPAGTDRIFVVSSYTPDEAAWTDGYTGSTTRPENEPQPITLEYSLIGMDVKSAMIRMFVDDFQSPGFGASYQVSINGKRIPYLENMINALDQTGPIGKLITIQLLPEDLPLVKTGRMVIRIDDLTTGAGDGFAIDFAELLINPKKLAFVQNISGIVVDEDTKAGIGGALVSATNVVETTTDDQGGFVLMNVPAGLALITASKTGYAMKTLPYDEYNYEGMDDKTITIPLKKLEESVVKMGQDIDKKGVLVLYGIHFEVDKATLTPESVQVLEQLATVIRERPGLNLEIAGHTDSDGTDEYNLQLSQNRSQAVVNWLVENGITNTLSAQGYGESSPVASNTTIEGKAANRRVEIRVIGEKN